MKNLLNIKREISQSVEDGSPLTTLELLDIIPENFLNSVYFWVLNTYPQKFSELVSMSPGMGKEGFKEIVSEKIRWHKNHLGNAGETYAYLEFIENQNRKNFISLKTRMELIKFVEANEIPTDSAEHYGVSWSQIYMVWDRSGLDRTKLWLLAVKRFHMDGVPNYDYVPHGEPIDHYKMYLKGVSLMKKWDIFFHALNVDRRILQHLGGMSPSLTRLQWVKTISETLSNRPVFLYEGGAKKRNTLRLPELPLQKLSAFQKLSKREQAAKVSIKAAWYSLYKRFPKGLDNNSMVNPAILDKTMLKTFRSLLALVNSFEGYSEPMLRLSWFFRDMGSIIQYSKKLGITFDFIAAHDLGQFWINNSEKISREAWKRLVLKFPEVMEYAPKFWEIEKKYGIPKNLQEVRHYATLFKYEGVSETVGHLASKYGLGKSDAKDYERFFNKTSEKSYEMLPDVYIQIQDYTFEKMGANDKEGLFLGLATDCCQHLHNAGSSCAKAGYRDGESGFFVIRKNGNIIAQSWAWRGTRNELVFDSIEALGQVNIEVVSELYLQAAKKLKGRLGISRILIGSTPYGITEKVINHLKLMGAERPAKMLKKVSYTDAKTQAELLV